MLVPMNVPPKMLCWFGKVTAAEEFVDTYALVLIVDQLVRFAEAGCGSPPSALAMPEWLLVAGV